MKRKQKYPPSRCIGIDIDGTLVIRRKLDARIMKWIDQQRAAGFDVVLWSARGRGYAERVAEHYGITDRFTAIIGKPGYIIDDLGWGWIKFTRVIRNLKEKLSPEENEPTDT